MLSKTNPLLVYQIEHAEPNLPFTFSSRLSRTKVWILSRRAACPDFNGETQSCFTSAFGNPIFKKRYTWIYLQYYRTSYVRPGRERNGRNSKELKRDSRFS